MSDVKVTIPRDDYDPNQRTNIDVEVVNPDGTVSTKTVEGAVQSTTQEDGSVSFGILASAHVPFVTGGGGYSATVLADSPVGYWRLGEASGTTATDSSGNGRNGTYTGSPTLGETGLIAGDADTCALFNGGQDVEIDDNAAWDSASWSVEAWVNPDATDKMIVTRWGGSSEQCWALDTFGTAGAARFYGSNTSGTSAIATGTTNIANGSTYHIVGTYRSSDKKFRVYVNGSLEGTSSALSGTEANAANTRIITIGERDGVSTTRWQGHVDEVAVYDYELTSTQIAAHYTAGTA